MFIAYHQRTYSLWKEIQVSQSKLTMARFKVSCSCTVKLAVGQPAVRDGMLIDRETMPEAQRSCKTELARTSWLCTMYNMQYNMLPSGSSYKAAYQEPGYEAIEPVRLVQF